MTDLANLNINAISEEEWISMLDKIKGFELIEENIDSELIEQGWSCLTPNTTYKSQRMWVKPESWTKLMQSVRAIKQQINKEIDKNTWLGLIKDKLNIKTITENNNNFTFYFVKYFKLPVMQIHITLKMQFAIILDEKNVNKWIKNYSKTGQKEYINEFVKFMSPDEKWDVIYSTWCSEIDSKLNSVVINVPESQRGPWYNWVKKSWELIYWNDDLSLLTNKWIDDLNQVQMNYEAEKAKHKKRIELINTESLLNFDHFEEHFFTARSKKREITFFMGPPNTGKTYNSFNMLSEAKNGAYWSPLRLLALEGHETLLDRGVLNDLITGEERKYSKGSSHVASTIEMANLRDPLDVAIIDEIQLLTDATRGWAWTQAYLGAPADQLVLTGSDAAIPYLENMNIYLGEEMNIQELKSDRKLNVEKSIGQNFSKLREGDALISFSRKDVLSWKEALELKGYPVSAIYGHLSPEIRREEARKFREGETKYLVSTDAIGLGLNLPIKRIIFTSLSKFDGEIDRILKPSELWQIANRAGRKGWVEEGAVTTWFEDDEDMLQILLNSKDEKPKDYKWWVQPLPDQVELWNKKMGGTLTQILEVFSNKLLQGHKIFKPAQMNVAIERAEKLKHLKLNITDLYSYATAPVDKDDLESEMKLAEWAYMHSNGKKIKWSDVKSLWQEKDSYHSKGEALLDIEKKVRLLTVYRWLTLRFPDIYYGNKEAMLEHAVLNKLIEKYLIEIVKNKEKRGSGKSQYKKSRSVFIPNL